MDQHKAILISNALKKADESLDNAKNNISNNFLAGAQNRIYYAIFYTVLALGYLKGFTTGKHSELLGWFNKKFVYEDKTFDSNISKIYRNIYKQRMKFDYDVLEIPEKEDIEQNLNDTIIFINTVKEYIYSQTGDIR